MFACIYIYMCIHIYIYVHIYIFLYISPQHLHELQIIGVRIPGLCIYIYMNVQLPFRPSPTTRLSCRSPSQPEGFVPCCQKRRQVVESFGKAMKMLRKSVKRFDRLSKRYYFQPSVSFGARVGASSQPTDCHSTRPWETAAATSESRQQLQSGFTAQLYITCEQYIIRGVVGLPRRYVLYLSTCPLDEAIGNPGLTTVLGCMIGYRCGTPMSHPHALRSLKQAAGATSAATAASSSSQPTCNVARPTTPLRTGSLVAPCVALDAFTHGQHTVNTRSTHGQHTVNTRSTHGQHTVNTKLKC